MVIFATDCVSLQAHARKQKPLRVSHASQRQRNMKATEVQTLSAMAAIYALQMLLFDGVDHTACLKESFGKAHSPAKEACMPA